MVFSVDGTSLGMLTLKQGYKLFDSAERLQDLTMIAIISENNLTVLGRHARNNSF